MDTDTGRTAALDEALEMIDELDRKCCEPGRSPRIAALRGVVEEARDAIEQGEDPAAVVALLEGAGARVGHLQVACCAPARIPLYAGVLERLMTTQLGVGPDMHAD